MVQVIKLAGLLRRASSALLGNCNDAYAGLPNAYITARDLSSQTIFVGGMNHRTTVESLRNAFSSHGEILQARLIKHRRSKRHKGFGFIKFSSVEEAGAAIKKMNGQVLGGRHIDVSYCFDEREGTGSSEGAPCLDEREGTDGQGSSEGVTA